jgi:hypothetical protein
MFQYFFHLRRSGTVILDPEGRKLAGIDEARREAVLDARELIIGLLRADKPVPMNDSIDVGDECGDVLYTVTFAEALGCVVGAATG